MPQDSWFIQAALRFFLRAPDTVCYFCTGAIFMKAAGAEKRWKEPGRTNVLKMLAFWKSMW